MSQEKGGGTVLLVIVVAVFILSTLIYVSRAIFQIAWFMAQVGAFFTILSIIFGSIDTTKFLGGITVILLVVSGITGWIGYGFGNSELGQTVIELDNAFDNISEAEVEAERAAFEATRNTTEEVSNQTNSTAAEESTNHIFFIWDLYLDIQSHLPWIP